MEITREVNNILVEAYEFAKKSNHEFVTAEHILYAITFQERFIEVIEDLKKSIDELRKNRPISKGAMDKLNRYNKAIEELQGKLLREPTTQEISNYLGISSNEVAEIENYINYISMVSLESVIFSDDEDVNLMGVIEDKNSPSPHSYLEDKEKLEVLTQAIELLKEKDRMILNLYYYEGLTLKEIGKILEVSESRVCQLHSRSIRNLRECMKKLHYVD